MTLTLQVGKHYRIPTERISERDLRVQRSFVLPVNGTMTMSYVTGLVEGVVEGPPAPIGGGNTSAFWRDRTIVFEVVP